MATGQPPQSTGLPSSRPRHARTACAAVLGCACITGAGWYLFRTAADQSADGPPSKQPSPSAIRQPTEDEKVRAAVKAWFERQRAGGAANAGILLTGGRDTPHLTDLRSWSILHVATHLLDARAGPLPPGDTPGSFLTGTADAAVLTRYAYRPGLRSSGDVRISLRRYQRPDGAHWQITAINGLKP